MENRPESFTAARSESSHFFTETVGPGTGNQRHSSAGRPSCHGRAVGGKARRGFCFSLILCILAAVVLLGTAGCSDSGSDDLVLSDAQWVAFQDGDGPWQELGVSENMVFDADELVTDPEGRYSLAIVFARAATDAEDNGFIQEVTLKTTKAEVPSIDFSKMFDPESTSLEVTLDEDSLDYGSAYLYVGGEYETPWGDSNTVTLYPYTAPYDLVATLHSGLEDYPSKILFETFDESAQGQARTCNIAFGDFVDLSAPYTVTFTPSADEILHSAEAYLVTANGTAASLGEEYNDGATSFEYTAPAALPAGGSYVLELSIDLDEDSSILHYQGFETPDDLAINGSSLPNVFDGQYAADTSTGSLLPNMNWTVVDDGGDAVAYASVFNGEANSIDYFVVTMVTAGRVGAEDTCIAMPDLSSAPGWYPLWSIPANAEERGASSWAVLSSENFGDLFASNLATLYLGGCPHLGNNSWVTVIMNSWEMESDPL